MAQKDVKINIGANTKLFFRALASIRGAIRRLSGFLQMALKPATMFLTAINALSGVALTLGVRKLAAYGAELNHMSSATGAAVDKLAVLNQAFQDAGLSDTDLRPSLNAMQKFIAESIDTLDSPRVKNAWERLRLDPRQLQGVKDPTQQFTILLNQLHQIPDLTERAAVAMQIFRNRGPQLLAINLQSIQDAEASLGSLPKRLAQMHVQLERIDTIIGRMRSKMHQFFAGFVGRHIDKLESVMENINRLDFAPLGERLADILTNVFSRVRKLMQLLFSGDLWKFLEHKILELAHKIGFAIKSALMDVLSQVTIPTKDGDYPLFHKVIATRSPEATRHRQAADKLWNNTIPISQSLSNQNPLYKFANFLKKITTSPAVRNNRLFHRDPDGLSLPSITPRLSAPVVSALQSIGGGGNIGQSSLPSIQQNTARANQLSQEHMGISRQILDALRRPSSSPVAPTPIPNY